MARRLQIAVLLGVLAWVGASPAHAQQPISGNYPGGAVAGMKGSILPPPGKFLLENGTLFYNTRQFVDGSGRTIPTDVSNIVANRTMFDEQVLIRTALRTYHDQWLRQSEQDDRDTGQAAEHAQEDEGLLAHLSSLARREWGPVRGSRSRERRVREAFASGKSIS